MKQPFIRILCLMLAVILALGCTGCGKDTSDWLEGELDIPDHSSTSEETGDRQSTSIEDADPDCCPAYVHIESDPFYTDLDELEALIAAGSTQEALELYDDLYARTSEVNTQYFVAHIHYCENVDDEYYETEKEYTYNLCIDLSDRLATLAHELAVGPDADLFADHLDDSRLFDYYTDYVQKTQEQKDLADQEMSLVNDYNNLITCYPEFAVTYDGVEYTYADLTDSSVTWNMSEEQFYAIYDAWLAALNEACGDIYLQLVSIRNRIARLAGYDNYCDYADDKTYSRDYGTAEALEFHKASRDFFSNCTSTWNAAYYLVNELDSSYLPASEQLSQAKTILENISPYCADTMDYMLEHNLTSIGNDDSRLQVGYTTGFPSRTGSAFLYNYCYGSSVVDVHTILHEMGHFTEYHRNGSNLFYDICFDVAEIHSTGLEVLSCPWLDTVYDEETADLLTAYTLENLISLVRDGCVFDQWQREIYQNPDMTLAEINALYAEIADSYDMYGGNDPMYWMWINHNFESPMYYLSYASSAIVSLQLYELMLTDYDAAVDTWETIVDHGDEPYMQVVQDAGLAPFSDAEAMEETLNTLYGVYYDLMSPYVSDANAA